MSTFAHTLFVTWLVATFLGDLAHSMSTRFDEHKIGVLEDKHPDNAELLWPGWLAMSFLGALLRVVIPFILIGLAWSQM